MKKIFRTMIFLAFWAVIAPSFAFASADIMAPNSAGAQSIAGVNWGDNIVITDNSITINGAHIIPLPPNGPKTFKVEYGSGQEGANGQPANGSVPLGFSPEITSTPPYNFTVEVPNLAPNTYYYFTLWEVVGAVSNNLFTYGYTLTNQLTSNQTLSIQLQSSTSARIYGNMVNAAGIPLVGAVVDIEIHAEADPGSPIIQEAQTTITAGNLVYGAGYYEHVFGGLVPDTQYYVLVRNSSTGAVLVNPLAFTMPSAYVPGLDNTVPAEPSYNGLVACGGADCDFNTLIDTINRVINFLIFYIGFPMVAIVSAWAGVKLLTSGGNPSAKEKAKDMLFKVVIGLIVALLCWAIIKLILITLGYVPTGPLWGILGTTPE